MFLRQNGGFTNVDGTFAFLVPYDNGVGTPAPSGLVPRIDLTDFSTVDTLDLTLVDPDLKGFIGGFSDGTVTLREFTMCRPARFPRPPAGLSN